MTCCRWRGNGRIWLWAWLLGIQVLQSFGQGSGELQNCTVEYRPNLQCHVMRSDICAALEVVPKSWPPAPTSFTVGTYLDEKEFTQDSKKYMYVLPGLKFTWKPPQNIGAQSVTGFEIMVKNVKGNKVNRERCVTLNLTDQIHVDNLMTTFEYRIFPVEPLTLMMVVLHSLPKPAPEHSKENMVIRQVLTPSFLLKGHMYTANWQFGMNFANDSCKRQVSCSFTVPPADLNITRVKVHLLKVGDTNYYDTKEVRMPQHHAVFQSVEPSTYSIRLVIVDENWNNADCLCRGASGGCSTCLETHSEQFMIVQNHSDCPSGETTVQTSAAPMVTTEMKTSNPPWQYLVGPAIGIMGAVVLVALLIIALKNYDRKCWGKRNSYGADSNKPDLDPPQENNNVAKTFPVLKERVIYLVYTDDHIHHQRAVKLFAKYLKKYCRCNVRFPAWCLQDIQARGTINWVLHTIQEADYVIIINSEGAFKLNKARKENSTPCRLTDSPIGDIFTPAITNIIDNFYKDQAYKKYIMMQFHYSDDKFQIREISPGYRYVLMKHFRELICHIHEINPEKSDSILGNGISLPADAYTQTEEGKELLQAVNEAHVFTKSHPHWFDQMYGSDEDRYDSGLSSLPLDSFPDHLKEQIRREYIENTHSLPPQETSLTLNTDLDFLHVPGHDNFDAHSITQSQVYFEPPKDLYSISTDLHQPDRSTVPCQMGHQVGGHPLDGLNGNLMQHYCGTYAGHAMPACLTDSGRNSQRSSSSQAQSSSGPFNILGETPSFVPPIDDTDSHLQYNGVISGDANGRPLILPDNISWDAMSV